MLTADPIPLDSPADKQPAPPADKPSMIRFLGATLVLVLLGGVYALLAQVRYPGGGDAPYHLLSAQAWAGGSGFNPHEIAQTKYPPGWSLALTALTMAGARGYAAAARFTAALFPLALLASYVLFRLRSGVVAARWMTCALLLSAGTFDVVTRSIRSEVLYTVVSIAFLVWCERIWWTPRVTIAKMAAGAFLLTVAVLTRTIGVALFAAVFATVVHLWITRRGQAMSFARRLAAPSVVAMGALATWKVMSRAPLTESYPGELMNLYGRQFWMIDPHRPSLGMAGVADVLLRIPANISALLAHSGEMFTNLPWLAPSWTSPVVVLVALLLVAGLIRELRRPLPLPAYYGMAYVGILSVWPFDEGTRFVVPLFPVLLIFAASGMEALWNARANIRWLIRGLLTLAVLEVVGLALTRFVRPAEFGLQPALSLFVWLFVAVVTAVLLWRRQARPDAAMSFALRLMPMVIAVVVGGVGAARIARLAAANRASSAGPGNGFQQASAWIAANTVPSAVVMAQRPLDFQLATGRPGALFPVTTDATLLHTALTSTKTRELVVYATDPAEAYYFPLETDRLAMLQTKAHLVRQARMNEVSIWEVR